MAQNIIRVLPAQSNGWNAERYHDIGDLSYAERSEIVKHLTEQGFLVQNVYLEDITPLRVALELRKRDEAEREANK